MLKKIVELYKRIALKICMVAVNSIASSIIMPLRLRFHIYRLCGIHTETLLISPHCFFRTPKKINIGRKTYINNRCFIGNNDFVSIGDNCSIGMNVVIGTDTHEIGNSNNRAGRDISLPVSIGNGCWIGARVTILAGVTIGEGCVIAAGSVVTKDCKPNGLYAGVPAVFKRQLSIEN